MSTLDRIKIDIQRARFKIDLRGCSIVVKEGPFNFLGFKSTEDLQAWENSRPEISVRFVYPRPYASKTYSR